MKVKTLSKNVLLSLLTVVAVFMTLNVILSFLSGISSRYSPDQIEVDNQENIYLLLPRGDILKYSPDVKLLARVERKPGFNPKDICISEKGEVYVAARFGKKMGRIDEQNRISNIIELETGFMKAFKVDRKGNIYITEGHKHFIRKLNPKGEPIWKIGGTGPGESFKGIPNGSGEGPGEFDYPKDIAVDRVGNVYVADSGNHRIQKFDADGKFLSAFHKDKKKSFRPEKIIIGKDNYLYISEYSGINQFKSNGEFVTSLIKTQDHIWDFAQDSEGNFYTISGKFRKSKKLGKYDSKGEFITELDIPRKQDKPLIIHLASLMKDGIYSATSPVIILALLLPEVHKVRLLLFTRYPLKEPWQLKWFLGALLIGIVIVGYLLIDTRRRYNKISPRAFWITFTFLFAIIGLPSYLIFRPKGVIIPCPKCARKKLIYLLPCPYCGYAGQEKES